MPVIAPSILSADFANLERDIHDIERSGADWVHVDVMDGIFVPNISIGIPVVKALRPVTSLPLDVHLMIDRPIRYAEEFIKAGADWLTIHLESDQPQNTLACLDKIRAMGCKAAISLKPKTPAEAAIPYLTKCDMVLVMTVEPGFGAQKFMADMMPKVKKIRQMLDEVNPACIIEVDGGVKQSNAARVIDAGADVIVGAHTHCLQGMEFYKNKPIIYSVGNFWFNSKTLDSCVMTFTVDKDMNVQTQILPLLQKGCETRLLTAENERRALFDRVESYEPQGVSISDDGIVTSK